MMDWGILAFALCDALGVLLPACIIAFWIDAFVYAMLDCTRREEDNVQEK